MKKIIFILTILVFLFLAIQVNGKSKRFGISELSCRKSFESAGVYNETVGIYRVECTAEVSSDYNCKKWQYNFITDEAICLRFILEDTVE